MDQRGFQPGHFHQGIHQKFQFFHLVFNNLGKLLSLLTGKVSRIQHGAVHSDIGNRGFQLMGNIRYHLLNLLLLKFLGT